MTVFYGESDIAVSHFIDKVKNEIEIPKKIRVFDTTLRDGEQTPGVALIPQDKLRIAIALDELGVDSIESGFPITSEGEKEGIRLITKQGLKAEVCGLARTNKRDIDDAISCDVDSIHTFIATSDIHMKHKLKMTEDQVIDHAIEAIEYIKDHGLVAEFSAEDATRTKLDFLKKVHTKVQEAKVDRINVPDTVGVMIPRAVFWLVKQLKEVTKVPMSIHCHNDFGLAVPNTLAAIEAGCEQFHATVNGLGERAGNASLEETIMGLIALYKVKMNINTQKICEVSDLTSRLMGVSIQPNKAIVGQNAFSHESGIHVHGVLGEDSLLERARELTGVKEKTALVRLGLEALIALESARRLAALGGSEKKLKSAPRRRTSIA